MVWTVGFHRKAAKQLDRLPLVVRSAVEAIVTDLENNGPSGASNWPHYSKLKRRRNTDQRHCHLTRGHPTYVCCWEVINKHHNVIEVYYVGTHEKAPY